MSISQDFSIDNQEGLSSSFAIYWGNWFLRVCAGRGKVSKEGITVGGEEIAFEIIGGSLIWFLVISFFTSCCSSHHCHQCMRTKSSFPRQELAFALACKYIRGCSLEFSTARSEHDAFSQFPGTKLTKF